MVKSHMELCSRPNRAVDCCEGQQSENTGTTQLSHGVFRAKLAGLT